MKDAAYRCRLRLAMPVSPKLDAASMAAIDPIGLPLLARLKAAASIVSASACSASACSASYARRSSSSSSSVSRR